MQSIYRFSLALLATSALTACGSTTAPQGSGDGASQLASVSVKAPRADGLEPGQDYVSLEVWTAHADKDDWTKAKSFAVSGPLNDETFSFVAGTYRFDVRIADATGKVLAAASASDAKCPFVTKTLEGGRTTQIDIALCQGVIPVGTSLPESSSPSEPGNASVAITPTIVSASETPQPTTTAEHGVTLSLVSRDYRDGALSAEVDVRNDTDGTLDCRVLFVADVAKQGTTTTMAKNQGGNLFRLVRGGHKAEKATFSKANFANGYLPVDMRAELSCTPGIAKTLTIYAQGELER